MIPENVKATPASPPKRAIDELAEGLLEEVEEEEFRPRSRKRRLLIRPDYASDDLDHVRSARPVGFLLIIAYPIHKSFRKRRNAPCR
jgi:hypothetical protein